MHLDRLDRRPSSIQLLQDASAFAQMLAHAATAEDAVTSVTWLNHWSMLEIQAKAETLLLEFDFIGIDGQLLQRLVGEPLPPRTSADLVLPMVLLEKHLRVALLGSSSEKLNITSTRIETLLDESSHVVAARNG